MSNNQHRQPRGVPVGGQFAATARAESGLQLSAGPIDQRDDHMAALSDLLDAYMSGNPIVADETASIANITPFVPGDVAAAFWQDAVVAHLHHDERAREKALGQIAEWGAREARWRTDPTFTSPTGEVSYAGTNGPVVYTTVTGSKYTGYRPAAEVAKDVRADLKGAQKAGYLPGDLTFSVTTSSYSGGQSLCVSLRGMADEDIYGSDPASWQSGRTYSAATREVRTRVEAIAGAYGRDTTDIQTDYFHVTYWCQVDVEDEERATWREQERVRIKAARERRTSGR